MVICTFSQTCLTFIHGNIATIFPTDLLLKVLLFPRMLSDFTVKVVSRKEVFNNYFRL